MRRPRIFDHNRYPVRRGNCVDLMVNGEIFYPRMLSAIINAKHTVILEQYLVKSGKVLDPFVEAFCNAAFRGVKVVILLDAYGSRALSAADRERLQIANVSLHFYNPVRLYRLIGSLFRNHRKLLLVDGSVAFVGGAGINDEFLIPQKAFQNSPWRDVMLEIKGPIIADWLDLFRYTLSRQLTAKHDNIDWTAVTDQCNIDDKDQQAQVLIASALGRQEISQAFLGRIHIARRRVWLSTPYFVTTKKIRRALIAAARRGVDTRLLLPGEFSDHPWVTYASQRFYQNLLNAGVRIFEFQKGFSHSKIQLVDDWVSIGSCNLDRWNMHWNLDANQAIASKRFAQTVADLLSNDFALSQEIARDSWSRRSLVKRFKSLCSSFFVKIVEKFFSWF